MNTDKAYLLGLIVGGGVFTESNENFSIKLPYNGWGDAHKNPTRAGQIANDILKSVRPVFKSEYGFDISYSILKKYWQINCIGDLSIIRADLKSYDINPWGEIRKNANMTKLISALVDNNMKRRFIAGLADTIGSTAPSHRRFSDDIQIISFEIAGFNYRFVCDLCRLLSSIGCHPDQILWNHPNMHSGSNPYYKSWKKGFKLRVELDQYAKFGAFAFKAKVESSKENRAKQTRTNVAEPCIDRKVNINNPVAVHVDENYYLLPKEIKGGHYIHHKHICAVLGCENAPLRELDVCLSCVEKYISPFPTLYKDSLSEVMKIVKKNPIFNNRTYTTLKLNVKNILNMFVENKNELLWGNSFNNGYEITEILQAVAFVIADKAGKLNGKRVRGSYIETLNEYIKDGEPYDIQLMKPEILTPVIIHSDRVAAMVGPTNPTVYKKLVSRDKENKYKIYIREITEDDLNDNHE